MHQQGGCYLLDIVLLQDKVVYCRQVARQCLCIAGARQKSAMNGHRLGAVFE